MLSSTVHTLIAAIIWSSGDMFTANAGNCISRRSAYRSGMSSRRNAMMAAKVQRRAAPTNDAFHSERRQLSQIDVPPKRRRKSLQSLLFGAPATAVLTFSASNNAGSAFASTLADDEIEEETSVGDESANSFTFEQIMETIKDDIIEHQYLITGDLNDVIYMPECEFKQPLQTIKGTADFKKRIGQLWDQSKSSVELLEVSRDDATHIVATWRITGALKNFYLFGSGKLAPFIGRTRYTLDPDSNKIVRSYEDWESTPWG